MSVPEVKTSTPIIKPEVKPVTNISKPVITQPKPEVKKEVKSVNESAVKPTINQLPKTVNITSTIKVEPQVKVTTPTPPKTNAPVKLPTVEKPVTKVSVVSTDGNRKNETGKKVNIGYYPYTPVQKQNLNIPKDVPKDVAEMITQNAKNPKWENYKGNYFIYSKENSKLYILDNKHHIIDSSIAGRGKDKGDYTNTSDADDNDKKPIQPGKMTTSAGRYAFIDIDRAKKEYDEYDTPFNSFYSDKLGRLGVHGIWKGELDIRTAILNNPQIKEKLMSYGCINVPKDFILKYQPNLGDSLFITKEPKGI